MSNLSKASLMIFFDPFLSSRLLIGEKKKGITFTLFSLSLSLSLPAIFLVSPSSFFIYRSISTWFPILGVKILKFIMWDK